MHFSRFILIVGLYLSASAYAEGMGITIRRSSSAAVIAEPPVQVRPVTVKPETVAPPPPAAGPHEGTGTTEESQGTGTGNQNPNPNPKPGTGDGEENKTGTGASEDDGEKTPGTTKKDKKNRRCGPGYKRCGGLCVLRGGECCNYGIGPYCIPGWRCVDVGLVVAGLTVEVCCADGTDCSRASKDDIQPAITGVFGDVTGTATGMVLPTWSGVAAQESSMASPPQASGATAGDIQMSAAEGRVVMNVCILVTAAMLNAVVWMGLW